MTAEDAGWELSPLSHLLSPLSCSHWWASLNQQAAEWAWNHLVALLQALGPMGSDGACCSPSPAPPSLALQDSPSSFPSFQYLDWYKPHHATPQRCHRGLHKPFTYSIACHRQHFWRSELCKPTNSFYSFEKPLHGFCFLEDCCREDVVFCMCCVIIWMII